VCLCPVDPVCHHFACHWYLFSLSRTRNRRFIALFTLIHFAISATPSSQRTLFTYLWYVWRQSWRCAKYSNSVYVAAFHEFLHVWDDHALEVRYSLSMMAAVTSPCATQLSQKLLSCATGVRLRVNVTVTVTIRVRVSFSIYGYGLVLKLEGKRHRAFLWKIESRLLSTPPLISFTHTIGMYLCGGRGSHYIHKGSKYDIKW